MLFKFLHSVTFWFFVIVRNSHIKRKVILVKKVPFHGYWILEISSFAFLPKLHDKTFKKMLILVSRKVLWDVSHRKIISEIRFLNVMIEIMPSSTRSGLKTKACNPNANFNIPCTCVSTNLLNENIAKPTCNTGIVEQLSIPFPSFPFRTRTLP